LAGGGVKGSSGEYTQDLDQINVQGDRVYYREAGGAIAWVKMDASDCRVLAYVPMKHGFETRAWAMDDKYVYVIESDERLYAIPK
jgi:hypothetical protein